MPATFNTSDIWGTITLTVPAGGTVQGSFQPCKSTRVFASASTVKIAETLAKAAANAYPLPTSPALSIPMPVSNVDKLYFYGSENDKVYIIWRL